MTMAIDKAVKAFLPAEGKVGKAAIGSTSAAVVLATELGDTVKGKLVTFCADVDCWILIGDSNVTAHASGTGDTRSVFLGKGVFLTGYVQNDANGVVPTHVAVIRTDTDGNLSFWISSP